MSVKWKPVAIPLCRPLHCEEFRGTRECPSCKKTAAAIDKNGDGTIVTRSFTVVDWSQIVQQHGPLVWTTVYRLLRHDADAADCFQRTFLSALVLSRTQTVRNWPGLLRRLGTARALESLRQRLRQAQRVQPLLAEIEVSSNSPEPDQAAAIRELSDHLREALAELDARQAQVFCLICLDGLSYAETADELGLTTNHVGVLLNRARLGLRDRLRGHEPAAARRVEEVEP
jgi:RNA polymerase sigma-70 factor (ECF subfamily)